MAKILVIANIQVPPIHAGSQKCISNYCETLRELGHEVYFLFSGHDKQEEDYSASEYWKEKYYHYQYSFFLRLANFIKRKVHYAILRGNYSIGYYYPAYGLSHYVECLQKKQHFDAVIVNYPWMTPLLKKTSIPVKLLFTHDKFTNKKELIKAEYYSLTAKQEATALDRADFVLSIQDEETEFFKKLLPRKNILTVYTQFEYRETLSENKKNVLFFSGDSDLNRNGINFFLTKVWPLVINEVKEAHLIIGGGICKGLKEHEKIENVEFAGYIDDVDEFYRRGNIAINPVYQGTGLKIKTLEAMSYGKITIVHPHSMAGLFKKEGVPVLVGDNAGRYAELLVKALSGDIDPKETSKRCRAYLFEMNNYIVEQYKKIKFK